MASILNTGISALNAFQRQLSTTGHNIANVNTEGYSRQRLDLNSRTPTGSAGMFIGSGVEVASIRRNYDDFLVSRVRSYNASQQEHQVFYERATQIDSVVADQASGIDSSVQAFFASVQDVSADPSSVPARNVMLNRSQELADRFQSLSGWLDDVRSRTSNDLGNAVDEINQLGQSIAHLNTRLQALNGQANNPPNDLLDQRDHLIDQLSEYVSVSTLQQDDGSMNVFIGTGQSLVVGADTNSLVLRNNPQAADHKEIGIAMSGGGTAIITDQLTGGKIGGLLKFRDQVLDPTQNSLGLLAVGLADSFNQEHITGMDLDGDLGGAYFAMSEPEVLGAPTNGGSVSVDYADVSNLLNHEYNLHYDGTAWQLDDLSSGRSTTLGASGPFVIDGMNITIGANATAGDQYRLRPTRLGASTINNLLTDVRDIAAAEAVVNREVSGNTGTAHLSSGGQTSSVASTGTPASLSALPVTMTYDSAQGAFSLSSGGTLAYDPTTDSGTPLSVTIPGLGDYSFSITGTPGNGDSFVLENNTGGLGDNRNARRLADLQSNRMLFGNTATLSDAYGFMVADVGTQTHQARSNAEVQEQLLTQAESAKSAVSGVNLDEEAADLVRFQQAYAAAAQVISTANTLFDTLIGAVRR